MNLRRGLGIGVSLTLGLVGCSSSGPVEVIESEAVGDEFAPTVLPVEIASNGELISVAASGALVVRTGRTICVYDRSGAEEFCRDLEDTNLRLRDGVYTPEWNANGDEVAFEIDGGTVMIVKLHSDTIDWFGGRDEAFKAATPFWTTEGWAHLAEPTGTTASSIVGGGNVIGSVTVEGHFATSPRVDFVALTDSVLLYTGFGEPATVFKVAQTMDLAAAQPVTDLGDQVVSVIASPTTAAVVFGSIDRSGEAGVRWHLVTNDAAVELPFSGVAAAPAPDGSGAIGFFAGEPAELQRFDVDTGTTTRIFEFPEPPGQVFWSQNNIVVRVGNTVYSLGL